MNSEIKNHHIKTNAKLSGQTIEISKRWGKQRKYRYTIISIARVSKHWLDKLDELLWTHDVLFVHHHKWGAVIYRIIV